MAFLLDRMSQRTHRFVCSAAGVRRARVRGTTRPTVAEIPMKRIAGFCLIVAVAVLSRRPSAQSKPPDFSGTWVQNMEKSSIPAGSSLQAFTNEIEQAGDTLKVVTILRRAGQDTKSERTFVIGKEEEVAGPGDIAITTRVKWEDEVLVFEAINPFMKDSDPRDLDALPERQSAHQ